MTRVSTAEMYDDKDVITQICKLKDGLNSALGGIIADIDVVGNDLVIEWADGESISLPLPNPTGISSIAGVVSGGNLTMTIYMTDGSSHAFTCPLNGMASETYVDTKDAQNVKLSGDQTIADVKTFIGSANVPTTPADLLGASAVNEAYVNNATDGVNNIAHKSGAETINGSKTFTTTINTQGFFNKVYTEWDVSNPPSASSLATGIIFSDKNGNELGRIMMRINPDTRCDIVARCRNANGTYGTTDLANGNP